MSEKTHDRFNKMRFNRDLIHKIWRHRKGDPSYSFYFGKFLPQDKNIIKNHPLVGKKIYRKGKDGNQEHLTITTVQVHFYEGYYYQILADDDNGSTAVIHVTINQSDKWRKDGSNIYTMEDGTSLKQNLKKSYV